VLDAAAERHLGQIPLAEPLVGQSLGTGRAGQLQSGGRELEHLGVRREATGHVVWRDGDHEVIDVIPAHKPRQHDVLGPAVQRLRVDTQGHCKIWNGSDVR
jgi:hypothetical protein